MLLHFFPDNFGNNTWSHLFIIYGHNIPGAYSVDVLLLLLHSNAYNRPNSWTFRSGKKFNCIFLFQSPPSKRCLCSSFTPYSKVSGMIIPILGKVLSNSNLAHRFPKIQVQYFLLFVQGCSRLAMYSGCTPGYQYIFHNRFAIKMANSPFRATVASHK
jgi:hypothetical protein